MLKYVTEFFRDAAIRSQKFIGLNRCDSGEIFQPEVTPDSESRASTTRNHYFLEREEPREIPRPSRKKRSFFDNVEKRSIGDCRKKRNDLQGKIGPCDEKEILEFEKNEDREKSRRRDENCCRKHAEKNCGCENCTAIGTMSECGVCLEPLQTRGVRSCPLCANLVCSDCAAKLSRCAFCRTCLPIQRNRAVERLLSRLHLPCRNARSGCKKFLKYEDRVRHEASCDHATVTCPISKGNCSWEGSPVSMLGHLSEIHALRPLADHGVAVEISSFRQQALAKEGEYTIYLSCYSQLFAVKVIICRRKLILTFAQLGYICRPTEEITRSRYAVWIRVNGGAKQIRGVLPFGRFNRETREIEINSDKLFSKGHGKCDEADTVKIEISIKDISARSAKN